MEDVIVKFTSEQFLQTTEPYDYLVSIDNPMERDREIAAYKKFALKNCDISAVTFKNALKAAYAKTEEEKTPGKTQITEFTGQKFPLRCPGYYCNDSGVWKDGAFGPIRVLMHPIMPIARIVDYETHEHKTAVAFRIGKEWITQIVSRDVLSSRAAFTRQMSLADAFVTSENCAGVISFLADVESANIDKLPVSYSASRLGWHGHKFLPFEEDLLFDGNMNFKAAFDSIEEHGSKKAWFDFAKKVRKNDWVIERIMLAASFASVLIEPLKALPFFVHCWTDISGTGKTVSMMFGGSAWGNPRIGKYCQGLNITNVGVEMMAGFLGSLPLCMDELCTKDKRDKSKEIENMVYNYCLNTGRIRGSRNGGIQRVQTWANCALTTGEMPIVSDDSRAGAANRVIEIECNEKLFGGKAKEVAGFLSENYGFAGKMFVELVQQDGAIKEIAANVDKYEEELKATGATDKQYNSMAIILAADKFATDHLFMDGRCLTCDDVSLFLKKETDVDTNRKAYDALMGRVIANNKRFEPRDDRTVGTLLGSFETDKITGDTYVCIIRSEIGQLLYNRENDTQYNIASFLKWAKRKGVVTLSAKDEPTVFRRLKEKPDTSTRVVRLKMNAFDSPVDDKPAEQPGKGDIPEGFTQTKLNDEELPW